MADLVIGLSDKSTELKLIGGKAVNLIKLYDHFPVPNGFVVTTEAYNLFVRTHDLNTFIQNNIEELDTSSFEQLEAISQTIRDRFHSKTLPKKIVSTVKEYYRKLQKKSVAVRSSASAEDLPGYSFAGQQDTFLNITTIKDLSKAIVRCMSSLWTARAIQYRKKNNISQEEVSIAVVIQEMVSSETSGVMFTANPKTNRHREIVIEAITGLGEALVSGQVEPDTYITDFQGQVKSRFVGNQTQTIEMKEEGGTSTRTTANSTQVLPDEEISELAVLGASIDEMYDLPQDIEWARAGGNFYILQSRPITTLYPVPNELLDGPFRVLTSINTVQGVIEPITPLGQEILIMFLVGIGKAFKIDVDFEGQEAFFSAGHRVYLNILPLLQNPVARRIVPRFFMNAAEPETGKIMQYLIQEGIIDRTTRPKFRELQRLTRNGLFMLGQARSKLANPDKAREEIYHLADHFLRYVEKLRGDTTTVEDKLDFAQNIITEAPRLVFLHLFPIIFGSYGSLLAMRLFSSKSTSTKDFYSLTKGMPHNITTEMNLQIWDLTEKIRNDTQLRTYFDEASAESIANDYRRGKLPDKIATSLENFLLQYGFRGFVEIDIGRKRWKDQPEVVISTIKSYLTIEDETKFPDNLFKKAKKEAQEAFDTIFATTKKSFGGTLRAEILNILIKRNRKLAGMREYPKFLIVHLFSIVRDMMIDIGMEFYERDKLDDPADIFYLYIDEIRDHHTFDLKEAVVSRKDEFSMEMRRRKIPRVLLSSGEVFYRAPLQFGEDDQLIRGSGVSTGTVEGIARVMYHPGDELKPGEILVCPATDPSWTPLFQTASGIIMEIGGLMTHGAVVAREHGIPGIVGVANATTVLETGMRIKLDADQGIIIILDQ